MGVNNASNEWLTAEIVRQVNETVISGDEVRKYIEVCLKKAPLGESPDHAGAQLVIAAEQVNNDPIRTLALFFRARALALIANTNDGLPLWPSVDGRTLFAAAGCEAVSIDAAGEVVFDRAKFAGRVFRLLRPNGTLH